MPAPPPIVTFFAVLAMAAPVSAQSPLGSDRLTSLPIDRFLLPLSRGQQIEVMVYLPHTFREGAVYPVLVVPDADPLLGVLQTINFLWQEDRRVGPAILVGLPFGSTAAEIWDNRSYYLLPDSVGTVEYYGATMPINSGGGAAQLARFLHEELLPTLKRRYPIDSTRLGLAGFSMGGLFAAWHLVTHPGVFNDYLIVAPPLAPPLIDFRFERATAALQARGFTSPTRLFVSYAEKDLELVKEGAARWIAGWQVSALPGLQFRAEVVGGLRHDSAAIPGLMSGYNFLYAR